MDQSLSSHGYESNPALIGHGPDAAQQSRIGAEAGLKFLDEKAFGHVLNTLPKNIQHVVRAKIDKDGVLKKGVLDKIESRDAIFWIKSVVNSGRNIEVLTAS